MTISIYTSQYCHLEWLVRLGNFLYNFSLDLFSSLKMKHVFLFIGQLDSGLILWHFKIEYSLSILTCFFHGPDESPNTSNQDMSAR